MAKRKNDLRAESLYQKKPQRECPSFWDAVELFLKEQKILNRTPRTLEWHRENFHVLEKAFREQNISLNLPSITSLQLKHNFILYALEKFKNEATTVNNRLRTYRSFWAFLAKEGFVQEDITLDIKKLKEKQKVIPTLDETEIQAMFRQCSTKTFTGVRDLTMLKVLLDTGMRLKELVILSLDDLLLNEGYIKVDGKGQKERFVPVSAELKKVLKDYLSIRGNLSTAAVFVTLDNTPMKPRTVQGRLSEIAEKTQITKQTSPHIWRHTFAKYYILNGGDPFTLKKILGHADWAMVHRYIDMFAPEIKKQHAKFSPLKNL